jgi:hypothetical protein
MTRPEDVQRALSVLAGRLAAHEDVGTATRKLLAAVPPPGAAPTGKCVYEVKGQGGTDQRCVDGVTQAECEGTYNGVWSSGVCE